MVKRTNGFDAIDSLVDESHLGDVIETSHPKEGGP
jgi:hypothetical protein